MHYTFKTASLFIAILVFSSEGFSQKKLSFGVRSSVSLGSSYTGTSSTTNTTFNIGYSIGGLAEFSLRKPLSIRVEAAFTKKGFSDKVTFTDQFGNAYSSGKVSTNLYYFDVPVMAKISFGKVVKPYFLLGGWGGIYLGGKINYPEPSLPGQGNKPYHIKNLNYGIIAGVGTDFKISSSTLFLELRPCMGLAKVYYVNKLANLELGAGLKF